jgi:hypothetical protein
LFVERADLLPVCDPECVVQPDFTRTTWALRSSSVASRSATRECGYPRAQPFQVVVAWLLGSNERGHGKNDIGCSGSAPTEASTCEE